MNQSSRTSNVIKNMIGGVGGQIFTSILQFVCRTYFIRLLSQDYLGINGLFTNILSMLSLAELGVGQAIVFSMYKPIADNDEVHMAKLMNFYRSAYTIIGFSIAVLGASLIPFLDFFIKDSGGIENLRLIFALVLSNTVVSYFVGYKGAMLNADQKSYITVIIRNVFAVIQNVLQIFILIITHNYILYLIIQIITTFLSNLVTYIYVDKKYPFLVKYKKEKIDKTERQDIFKKMRGMMMHKFGGFILNGTDNLVISKFVGIIQVGLYSNYLMIINLVKGYVSTLVASLSASVGNLVAKESKEKTYEIFNVTLFVYFVVYSFCFTCFWAFFQPFIKLWIGESYLLSSTTVFIVLLNFFCYGMQDAINTFTNATGLFWETRYKPVIECIVNIGVSIVMAYKFGITGVFIGTFASYICTFWINPVVIYKKQFGVGALIYFIKYAMYLLITLIIAFSSQILCDFLLKGNNVLYFIARMPICFAIYVAVLYILFRKTNEFKYCTYTFLRITKRLLKR